MRRFLPASPGPAKKFAIPTKVLEKSVAEASVVLDQLGTRCPATFVSWNVNGLVSRVRSGHWKEFGEAVVTPEKADVISIQEVKMIAQAPLAAKKGDGLQRKRGILNTNDYGHESTLVEAELQKLPWTDFTPIWSLSDWKYAGTLVLLRKGLKVLGIRFNLDWGVTKPWVHHPEGRVICLEFESFLLLTTYSCNNGNSEESFERRRLWDSACTQFALALNRTSEEKAGVPRRPQVPQSSGLSTASIKYVVPWLESSTKPLVWIGDLNCAHTNLDLSHPKFFLSQIIGSPNIPRDCIGQPGCTERERIQFDRYVTDCELVDTFRELNSDPAIDPLTDSPPAEGPWYSWRGTRGVDVAERGKYYGKAMRIDYALIHRSLLSSVRRSVILGQGRDRLGFYGSDHCPVLLELCFPQSADVPALNGKFASDTV